METVRSLTPFQQRLQERSLAPLQRTSKAYLALITVLVAVIAWGAFAYFTQARDGLIVTGMRDRISWGLYVALFIFFIGASMAGTFVSAILRITQAGWRKPVTRSAEMVTVAALIVAALFITFDIGRPERIPFILLFGRWESPLVWDVYGLSTYLVGSLIYLYAALIPDLAYVRDRLNVSLSGLRRWFFAAFALGWRGTPKQHRYLNITLALMMILMVPVAVMMHTVTSWIFAMTLREPWDSPLFGIYFVGGAIFSGLGIIIILMAILRKAQGLEEFITEKHFRYLGYMMAAFAMIMLFFNANELVTHAYKLRGHISLHLEEMFAGALAPYFWTYFWGGLVLPVIIIALPATRNIPGIIAAAVLVNVGMFLERYLIVIGGMHLPLNPYEIPTYTPTWVEWSLTAAGVATFVLIIALLLKLVPSVAMWEMLEESPSEEGLSVPRVPVLAGATKEGD
ncbi:MAG: polysulfide reductase NrfD [Chloroflexi bacterium]|nr:polysulfide reductase NrfD [Chloroflexota bacterium]